MERTDAAESNDVPDVNPSKDVLEENIVRQVQQRSRVGTVTGVDQRQKRSSNGRVHCACPCEMAVIFQEMDLKDTDAPSS